MEIYQPEEDSYLLSEVLKKQIPKLSKKNLNLKVLEIGCGSGIQLTTMLSLGVKNITACDINPKAIKHCKSLGFKCINSNLFSKIKGRFDLIIFNPPYLPFHKFDNEKNTTGGKKGSEIINNFLTQAHKHLKDKGKIFLLLSNLTKAVDFKGYNKKIISKK